MNFPEGINLPLAYGPRDAKSLIIGVLSKEFPLSAKKIYVRVKSQNPHINLTYQAIHKSLKLLVAQKILTKKSIEYSLNISWVIDLQRFGEEVQSFYQNKTHLDVMSIAPGQSYVVKFDGKIIEMFYWVLHQFYKIASNSNSKLVCFAHHKRGWATTTVVSDKEYALMKQLFSKCSLYILCNGASPIDKYCLNLWAEHFGAKTMSGVPCAISNELFCIGDYVFELYLDSKADSVWEKIWKEVKSREDISKAISLKTKLHFQQTGNSKAIVYRDSEIAKKLRENTLKYFRKIQ